MTGHTSGTRSVLCYWDAREDTQVELVPLWDQHSVNVTEKLIDVFRTSQASTLRTECSLSRRSTTGNTGQHQVACSWAWTSVSKRPQPHTCREFQRTLSDSGSNMHPSWWHWNQCTHSRPQRRNSRAYMMPAYTSVVRIWCRCQWLEHQVTWIFDGFNCSSLEGEKRSSMHVSILLERTPSSLADRRCRLELKR